MVLLSFRSMCAKKQLLNGVLVARRIIITWQPLACQRWPFQSLRNHQIIKKRGVLLPNLVFLVYQALFTLRKHVDHRPDLHAETTQGNTDGSLKFLTNYDPTKYDSN
uniref:Uncharacterized protein n=1 Tax=Rhodosorus marinus TaxID=101924 RepID=A0A7S0BQL3_9RHOD